ncbi:MAG: hypothetical protein Q8R12_02085 [bacterium]|nr:hypothetical protein [bacterium]
MSSVLTIPKKLAQKGDLVVVPRAEYEDALRVKARLLQEEADTDEAIRIFEKEARAKKLKVATDFASILGRATSRRKK